MRSKEFIPVNNYINKLCSKYISLLYISSGLKSLAVQLSLRDSFFVGHPYPAMNCWAIINCPYRTSIEIKNITSSYSSILCPRFFNIYEENRVPNIRKIFLCIRKIKNLYYKPAVNIMNRSTTIWR